MTSRGRRRHCRHPAAGSRCQDPVGLEQLGVKADDFNLLAENALKDACGFTNPKQASHEEIVAIFRTAM